MGQRRTVVTGPGPDSEVTLETAGHSHSAARDRLRPGGGGVAPFAVAPPGSMRVRAPSGRPAERQRFRRLAQAALNADVTVEQVDTILTDMGSALNGLDTTLGGLDDTMERLDATLDRLSHTLDKVDVTVLRMADVVARLEGVVSRVEHLVVIGEAALRPLGAVEDAARRILGFVGIRR